jgi:hypothetical protein
VWGGDTDAVRRERERDKAARVLRKGNIMSAFTLQHQLAAVASVRLCGDADGRMH